MDRSTQKGDAIVSNMLKIREKVDNTIKSTMIAPCGMNCGICYAHMRDKKICPGCRGSDKDKTISCVKCRIKNCTKLTKTKKFCYSCPTYPCARLKQLDKRYRTKYGMSMIENLENIRKNGLREFTKSEKNRWKCPSCGYVICVHRTVCVNCATTRS